MLKDECVHWLSNDLSRIEDTPRLNDLDLFILHSDLAGDRNGQPTQLLPGPADDFQRSRVACARCLDDLDRQVGKQVVITVREAFHQVHFVPCSCGFQKDIR